MNKKTLLKAIQYLLSHDYLEILMLYPGLSPKSLNSRQALLSVTDVDQLGAEITGKSKQAFIEWDTQSHQKQTILNKNYFTHLKDRVDWSLYLNERHRGIRFYPWFRDSLDEEEENPYRSDLTPVTFSELEKIDQREYLEMNSDKFSWTDLREMMLIYYGPGCFRCGDASSPAVDHILPKSKYPQLEKDFMNLQILCRSCNSMKGNRHVGSIKKMEVTDDIFE